MTGAMPLVGGEWPATWEYDRYAFLLLLVAMGIALTFATDSFLTIGNLRNLLLQVSVLGIIAAGMTAVVISGGFDLSVGSIVALSGCVAALTTAQGGTTLGLATGIMSGLVVGMINGFFVGFYRVSPFIVTLGTMVMARGIALAITGGAAVVNLPESFSVIGTGSLAGLPVPVTIAAAAFALLLILLRHTAFGLKVYAVGASPGASAHAGVSIFSTLFFVYCLSGALAGVAGVVMAARIGSGVPTVGFLFELFAIAAVVLGGTPLTGGEGNVLWTISGVMLIGVLNNGLNLLGVHSFWQQVAVGLLFLISGTTQSIRRRMGT